MVTLATLIPPPPFVRDRENCEGGREGGRAHLDFYNRGGFSREIASGVNKTTAARCSGKLQFAPFPDLLEFFLPRPGGLSVEEGPQFIPWCMGSAVKRIVLEEKERSYDQSATRVHSA